MIARRRRRARLFLEKIGEIPAALQVKLLRAVQNKRIQRLGATDLVPIDVRMVAATNCDLGQEVAEGRFRQDLYYLLNVIRIDDLPLLITRIIVRQNSELGTCPVALLPACWMLWDGIGSSATCASWRPCARAAIFAAPGAEVVEISGLPPVFDAAPVEEEAAAHPAANVFDGGGPVGRPG